MNIAPDAPEFWHCANTGCDRPRPGEIAYCPDCDEVTFGYLTHAVRPYAVFDGGPLTQAVMRDFQQLSLGERKAA